MDCSYLLSFCPRSFYHRQLSNIDSLMARTACLLCFIKTVNGCSKKGENALKDVALEAGTQQNLSNLLFYRYLWLLLTISRWHFDNVNCSLIIDQTKIESELRKNRSCLKSVRRRRQITLKSDRRTKLSYTSPELNGSGNFPNKVRLRILKAMLSCR